MLDSKIAMVTGASRGIGAAILEQCCKQLSSSTLIATARSEAGLETINAVLKKYKVSGGAYLFDASSQDSLENLLTQIHADYPSGPDILVNNAGCTEDNLILRMTQSQWDKVMQTNLTSVYRLMKYAVRSMLKKRWGRIINISSVSAAIGNAGQGNYAASKAGLEALTRSIAREVAARGITCNCVCPGFVDTDMTRKLTQSQIDEYLKQIPLGRMGNVADIAHAVMFLASELAGYITGTRLDVNGGLVMD